MSPKRYNHVSECVFHDGWLDPLNPDFYKSFVRWPTILDCRHGQRGLCTKPIFSNMGKQAIMPHTKGIKGRRIKIG